MIRSLEIDLPPAYAASNPMPYYVALMAVSNEQTPVLTAEAKNSAARLRGQVGWEFVLTISVRAMNAGHGRLRITAIREAF